MLFSCLYFSIGCYCACSFTIKIGWESTSRNPHVKLGWQAHSQVGTPSLRSITSQLALRMCLQQGITILDHNCHAYSYSNFVVNWSDMISSVIPCQWIKQWGSSQILLLAKALKAGEKITRLHTYSLIINQRPLQGRRANLGGHGEDILPETKYSSNKAVNKHIHISSLYCNILLVGD